jgi:hypothetical protein
MAIYLGNNKRTKNVDATHSEEPANASVERNQPYDLEGLGGIPADATSREPATKDTQPNTLQLISTICSCVTTFLAIVGVSGLILNFKNASDASFREEQRKSEDLIARLYTMDIDLKKSMVNTPKVREYLFDDPKGIKFRELKASNEGDDRLINETRLFCGAYGNYFEYFLFHESYIQYPRKKAALRKEWRGYMQFVCDNSYAFREHLTRTSSSWSKEIIDIVRVADATTSLRE